MLVVLLAAAATACSNASGPADAGEVPEEDGDGGPDAAADSDSESDGPDGRETDGEPDHGDDDGADDADDAADDAADIPPPTAAVESIGGRPTLVLDGIPRDPLLFYGTNNCLATATPVEVGVPWTTFTTSFTAPEDQPSLGLHVQLGGTAGTVWIDDVSFADLADGVERVRGGGFDGTVDWRTQFTLFVKRDEGVDADATADLDDGALRVDIARPGTAGWHVHLYQQAHSLTAGHSYRLSVRLRAAAPRRAWLLAVEQGGTWRQYTVWRECPLLREVRRAAAAGLHLHSFGAPDLWPRTAGGPPAVEQFDQLMELLREADPAGRFVPRFWLTPPGWWYDLHPAERMLYEDGHAGLPSVASGQWLADAEALVRGFVRHVEGRWGDRVIGYHPAAQNTDEWFYDQSWEPPLPSFEIPMRDAFRAFARRRYADDPAALQAAWASRSVTFDTIEVPTAAERRASGRGALRDPATERRLIDWAEFQSDVMVAAIERMARAIKEETGRGKLAVFFYGYLFELGLLPNGPQAGGHLALQRLLDCPDVDVLVSPISYTDRGAGGTAPFMAAVDSIGLRGKLWLNEDDTRTHLSAIGEGFGRVDTAEQTRWVHRRNFGNILVRGIGTWWMDLPGLGWLDDDGIWTDLAALRAGAYLPELAAPRAPYAPEIAVIVDERSLSYLAYARNVTGPLLYDLRLQLNRLGAPLGFYLLDDLLAGRVPPARLYVMLDLFALDDAQRARLAALVRRDGRVAVWFYAPGYLGATASETAMDELLEMPVTALTASLPRPRAVWDGNPDHRLLDGLSGEFGSDSAVAPLFGLTAGAPAPTGPVTTLATWRGTADGAVLVREARDYTTIFSGPLLLPAAFLRNAAVRAGVWLWADTGIHVQTNGRWLAVTATDAAADTPQTIRLPRPATVVDVVSGATLGADATAVTLSLAPGETALLELRPPVP